MDARTQKPTQLPTPPGTAAPPKRRQDIEIEIDRIEIAKEEKKKKYDMISMPESPMQEQVVVAVDGICTLCLGAWWWWWWWWWCGEMVQHFPRLA